MEGISDAHRRALDADGFVLIEGALPRDFAAALREQVRAAAVGQPAYDDTTQGVRWLVNKGRDFRRVLLHPLADPCFRHLLGEGYNLANLSCKIVRPGAAHGTFHVDFLERVPEPFPEYALTANSLWLLDDFAADNGGTRLVPGSHRSRRRPVPDPAAHPDAVTILAPAGSLLLLHGGLWHASGPNVTERERVCLIALCMRPFLKPKFDLVHYLCDEAWDESTPALRRLLGFEDAPMAPDAGARPVRRTVP